MDAVGVSEGAALSEIDDPFVNKPFFFFCSSPISAFILVPVPSDSWFLSNTSGLMFVWAAVIVVIVGPFTFSFQFVSQRTSRSMSRCFLRTHTRFLLSLRRILFLFVYM